MEETEALLEKSVRSRLVSDVPLGVFLSGGVDSTLLASLTAQASGAAVKTFTVSYVVGSVGEGETAARTARALRAAKTAGSYPNSFWITAAPRLGSRW